MKSNPVGDRHGKKTFVQVIARTLLFRGGRNVVVLEYDRRKIDIEGVDASRIEKKQEGDADQDA